MSLAATLDRAAPPADLAPPLAALWWLAKGGLRPGPEWARAHEICQAAEGEPAHDLVHALVHRIEGDAANAAYWRRRAGDPGGDGDIAAEWSRIAGKLGG